jgi:hypothetical protein
LNVFQEDQPPMTVLSILNRAVAPVTGGHTSVDADGFSIEGTVEPGTDFYLRAAVGTSTATVTATAPERLSGRVLTGVALEQASHRLTPVALAIATEMAIEFDISWEAHEPWSDIVGDGCK